MEAKAPGGPKETTLRQSEGNPVQETSDGAATEFGFHEAESSATRMDKLLPNREHEDMAQERLWPMAAAQSASSDTQTVEEAEDDLQESDEVERRAQMQSVRRRSPESLRLAPGLVQKGRHELSKFSAVPQSTIYAK